MSDGNFNRSMLPYRDYQSGLRAGRAQMRTIAVESFKKWLMQNFPDMDEASLIQKTAEFKKTLE